MIATLMDTLFERWLCKTVGMSILSSRSIDFKTRKRPVIELQRISAKVEVSFSQEKAE